MNKFINYLVSIKSEGSKNIIFVFTILLAVIISIVHYFTYNSESIYFEFLHALLTKLYFIPVLIAALFLGLKEALQLAFIVTLFYLPGSIDTKLFSGLTFVEHLSEIILIWTVGFVSGALTDKLKKTYKEKARLAALEKVSAVVNVINKDVMNDYSACSGLAKSLTNIYDESDGNSFTVKLLIEKLERLGSHISHLSNLSAPKPIKKIKYNFFHLTKKCVNEIIQNNPSYNVSFVNGIKLPSVYMDVKQIEFAVKQISQSFIEQNLNKKDIVISAAKNKSMVEVSIVMNGRKKSLKNKKAEVFDLVANPETGYSFALASSIIKLHDGNVEFNSDKNGASSVHFYMPVSDI